MYKCRYEIENREILGYYNYEWLHAQLGFKNKVTNTVMPNTLL
jgi:hypothetical protein